MIKITLNGEERSINESSTLLEIIEELKLHDKIMAVALNMNIVKQENWASEVLKEGDTVEMMTFVAGG